jgi:hypothetical protein
MGKVRLSYALIAGGAAVAEREHSEKMPEMLTVYYMDGKRLLLTHFHMAGNQPRMEARSFNPTTGELRFRFLDATNLTTPDAGHMHSTTLRLVDDEHLAADWQFYENGQLNLDYAALGQFDSETRSGLAAYPYFDWGNVKGAVGAKRLPASGGSFLDLEASNAQVSAFKEAEDSSGYILRLRETTGRDGTARLRSPLFRITAAFLTDGVEENKSPLALKGNVLEIPLKANRFSTVRLLFTSPDVPVQKARK